MGIAIYIILYQFNVVTLQTELPETQLIVAIQQDNRAGCDIIVDELDERILEAMSGGIGVGPRLTELARDVKVPRSTANLRVRMLS